MIDLEFYKHKRVFITGHTGFKGAWMCAVLLQLGAEVSGYALTPPTNPSLYALTGIQNNMNSVLGDVRDFDALAVAMCAAQPEIVIHMAAQPIVREGYRDPVGTYAVNVMGTVHVFEAARRCGTVRLIINVTTDKVYENNADIMYTNGYCETDRLNGYDPYSNSKSCSELVTECYRHLLVNSDDGQASISVSSCRAGNVIGGGDFAKDRIIPDCVRAMKEGRRITVRNPYSIRPYQHVLEPVFAYLIIAQKQFADTRYAGAYNIGPNDCDCITTGMLADLFCAAWGSNAAWENVAEKNAPHEAAFLKLDCSKAKSILGWEPVWHIETAVQKTVELAKVWLAGEDMAQAMEGQILEYIKDCQSLI